MQTSNPLALLPLALFLVLFIGSGLYYQSQGTDFAFYQISAPVAIIPAIVLALCFSAGSLNNRLESFIKGIGDSTIITMVLVFLLAGAFASVVKAVGGVDATVNFGLSVIPEWLLLPGIFVIAAFIATSMGTSMGTIAAVAPVAVGLSESSDLPLLLTTGAVVGGAMFGDNLSIISDTTIAATRTQGCAMRDKFRLNLMIALPAAFAAILLLAYQSNPGDVIPQDYEFIKVVPYLVVLVLAVLGMNVMLVLLTGILLAGGVGFMSLPDYSVAQLSKQIYQGYTGMQEIIILSMLIGGLGALIKQQGGLNFIAQTIEKLTHREGREDNRRVGEFSIAASVAAVNLCTANNTVSIVIAGSLARDIAERYGVNAKRAASLMDIFSCVVQGMIPWGAQILLASSVAKVSPLELVTSVQYCWFLGLAAIISVIIARPGYGR
ncbi:Na+/H+ antiporter NhaC family protein [Aliamphritea hakodatensis]|uniref:Na+/H+ antiporter NhaC family protein n=1 Tax=Aliamphritea hakodatensis TaxID=2895352 RepID=UPI0022FD5678|nr:Na+/H+ antiporter NhaC family protein [Aliamphritea hakodatensis]